MNAIRTVLSALILLVPLGAFAQLTPVAFYHLGESDPGAVPGGPGADPTLDSAGAFDLPKVNLPTYALAPSPISSLAMEFAGADGYRNAAIVSTATDNFGLEAWAYTTTTAGNAVIAYNGNTGTAGWGLFRNGASWSYLYGGVVFGGAAPVQLNTWVHLAVVRDSGITTFYVNGRPVDVSGAGPNPPAGAFSIGINPLVNAEFHAGRVDEVRAFTFAPGTFSAALLLLPGARSIPTLAWQAQLVLALLLAGFAFWRVGRR